MHLPTGMTVQATARADEIYASFEGAVDRMEKQLRRYKRRLKDHHRDRQQPIEGAGAPPISSPAGRRTSRTEEPETLQPVIVAEMETRVPYLSVGEAVMQMELAGAPLLVFRNEAHGGVNVVYRRDDGNIGWIDPRNTQYEDTGEEIPAWSFRRSSAIDAVRAPMKATSKKRLLQDLADMAEAVYGLPSAAVYKSLMDREALGPTGVGRGVAIPHARLAGVET